MMNTGSALAANIRPVLSCVIIERFGNGEMPFVGSMILMGLGVVLEFRMRPEKMFGTLPLAVQASRSTPA